MKDTIMHAYALVSIGDFPARLALKLKGKINK